MLNVKGFICVSMVMLLSLGCINASEPVTPTTTVKQIIVPQPTTTLLPKEVVEDRQTAANAQKTGTDESACDVVKDQRMRDICIKNIAVKENNIGLCTKISTPDLVDNCYYRIATATKDLALCDRISNAQVKSICQKGT
ncbi:MAG: hypothetical protein V1875_00075 [Candidatus Altiarchaeota archaeon]